MVSNSSRNYITGLPVKSSWSVYSVPCFRATCTDEKPRNIKGVDHLSQSSLSGLNETTGRSSSSSTPPATTTSPLMLGNSLKIPQWHFVRVPSSAWRLLAKPRHTALWLALKYKVIKSLQFLNYCALFQKLTSVFDIIPCWNCSCKYPDIKQKERGNIWIMVL